eukprot:Gb_30290 [translate_table: standard]
MGREWPKVGCSIIMDGWAYRRNRPFLNIMVSCLRGPYFMRVIDFSLKEKKTIFQSYYVRPLDHLTLCVITDATPVYNALCIIVKNKYTHIYWTTNFVHAMNNMLKYFS